MIKDINNLIVNIEKEISKLTDRAVVGLSGGADSTLVAILCSRALGPENVYGVFMPYGKSDSENTYKAFAFTEHLNLNCQEINIKPAVDALIIQTDNEISKINQGNMRSRMRMISLYTVCCAIAEQTGDRVRVIGTGNLSEDFIGYDTKGGDALADFFPIGSLLKSEVYQLLEYFRDNNVIINEMINRVPSAGLWDGQTDEGELGYTYNKMEPYVLNMYKYGQVNFDNPISLFVYNRHRANKHKHEAPYVISLREYCEDNND